MENEIIDIEESQINERDIKSKINKVLISALIYFIFFNIVGSMASKFSNNVAIVSSIAVLISMIPIYFFIGKNKIGEIFKFKNRDFKFKDFIYFAGLFLIMSIIFNILTIFLMNIFNIKSVDVTSEIQQNLNPILAFYAILLGPLMEEIQYRGFYINHTRKYGAWMSIILSSIVFSLAHMNFLQGIGTLGIGLVLGYIGYFYSFKAAVVMHIWNNFLVSLMGLMNTDRALEEINFNPLIIIISIIIWILLVYSLVNTFRKERRTTFLNDLKITDTEKSGLRALFTNIFFWIYLIAAVAMTIFLGSVSK